jgi:hypothetical protein
MSLSRFWSTIFLQRRQLLDAASWREVILASAQGKKAWGTRIVANAAAGATARGVTIWSMRDTQSPRKQFSLGGSLGAGAGSFFRMLRGKPGRNAKIFRGAKSGLSGFLKPVSAALRVLFLEVSGFVFLCFSVAIVSAFLREYRKYQKHQAGLDRVILAGAISTMFFYFGVSSFWRARRKRSRI